MHPIGSRPSGSVQWSPPGRLAGSVTTTYPTWPVSPSSYDERPKPTPGQPVDGQVTAPVPVGGGEQVPLGPIGDPRPAEPALFEAHGEPRGEHRPDAGPLFPAEPSREPAPVGAAAGLTTVPPAAEATGTAPTGLLGPEPPELAGPRDPGGAPLDVGATAAGGWGGGTVWAVLGAAAVAAVLIAGGLWWTTNGTGTTTTGDDAEVAASPTTVGAETGASERAPAGSADGPASSDPSGTGTLAVADSSSSSATAPSTTRPSAVTSAASATSAVATSAATESTTSASDATSTSAEVDTTGTTGTTESTTSSTTTTTVSTTTTTVGPVRLGYIGDRVTIGGFDGDGLPGVRVELWLDADENGQGERPVAASVTDGDGRYFFDREAGCYEVRFSAPDAYEIRSGFQRLPVCIAAGQTRARIDAIADPLVVTAGPSGCHVERAGTRFDLGVEVYEREGDWGSSYTFYNASGGVVLITGDPDLADDFDGSNDREWFASISGYDHRSVRSVSATRNGLESAPVLCSRDS